MFADKIKFKCNMYEGEYIKSIEEASAFLTEKDLPDPYVNKNEVYRKIKEGNTHAVYMLKGNELYLTETRYEIFLRKNIIEEII